MVRVKRVQVTLLGIQNVLTGSDPSGELEIWGSLYASIVEFTPQGEVVKSGGRLWDAPSSSPVVISQEATIAVNRKIEFYIFPGQVLRLGGNLFEDDILFGTDLMLFRYFYRKYENIIRTHYDDVHFRETDQLVFAKYEVKRLPTVMDWMER
jgi:hypothetical protein